MSIANCWALPSPFMRVRIKDLLYWSLMGLPDGASANAGDARDEGRIPGLGRSPGGGKRNPLQYSCLENPMDKGDWQAIVHRVAKSRIWLKQLSTAHSAMNSIDLENCVKKSRSSNLAS